MHPSLKNLEFFLKAVGMYNYRWARYFFLNCRIGSPYKRGLTIFPSNTSLVSLCLQANAEMVPKFPSCYYMPLM